MNCNHCESVLLVEIFGTSSPIRCASCGSVAVPPNEASTKANRFAWRSFWLGLSSMILLCITGLPAIWYGVRSLMQMRFARSQKSDRKAAVAGVALGVVFGVLGTGLVTVIGGFVLFMALLSEHSNDPVRISQIQASIGTIDLPGDFQPHDGDLLRDHFRRVEWQDGFQSDTRGRMRLVKATPGDPFADPQIYQPKMQFNLDSEIDVDSDASEEQSVSWTFAGKTRSITKISEPATEGDFQVVRYVGSTLNDSAEGDVFVLAVCVREPGKYSEEDVQKIFESFVPAVPIE